MNTEKEVIKCIHSITNIPNRDITVEKSLRKDLNFDSMMIISLGMHLEEEIGLNIVQLTERIDFISDISVQDIINVVNSINEIRSED